MSSESEKKVGEETMLGSWMRTTINFWTSMMKTAADMSAWTSSGGQRDEEPAKGAGSSAWERALRANQAILAAMNHPETFQGLLQGVQAFPEIALKMSKSAWDGYFFLQGQWLEKSGTLGNSTKPYVFEELDQQTFRQWLETYEKEIRPLFNIPQLGLTRASQEKVNKALDRWNIFQIALSEFLYMLYLPIEKSIAVVQERVEEMSREGNFPEDPKSLYKMWIQTLEGHYMTLFKSAEYIQCLNNTLNRLHDFVLAEKETVSDVLKYLSIPSTQDVDEMAKDIHQMKKQIRQLTRKLEALQTKP